MNLVKNIKKIARDVLINESQAIHNLTNLIDDSFEACVKEIYSTKGRVVVTGVGKSAIIANKIVATLNSTGTPSIFMHAADAIHGDLGMITGKDVVLALSNSGETPELADILAHAKRFGIPLIGVAGRPGSTLLRQSDAAILLPDVPEACETGIVPTTSTTMTLALGDALAIALMEHRAFTPEHFRMFHPGGKLGARLLKVRDLMHDDPPLVSTETSMGDALLVISRRGFGVVGVNGPDGALVGIITDGDLRRHMDGLLSMAAGQVMTASPKTIGPDALAGEALAAMNDRKITCLLVTETGGTTATGIVHIHDCLRAGVA